jgi:hypothetical protein
MMKRIKRPQLQLFKTQREVDWRNPKTRAAAEYWLGRTKEELSTKKDPLVRYCPKHYEKLDINSECIDCRQMKAIEEATNVIILSTEGVRKVKRSK